MRELNVDRLLDVMRAHNDLTRALRRTIVEVAEAEHDAMHDALLVRAPLLGRIARAASAGEAGAAHLFRVLRPSIERAIRSERVGGRYVYRDVGRAEMNALVDRIGCSPLRNRYVEANHPDPALRQELAAYVGECALPLERRSVVRARGPLCFWDTSDVEDLRDLFYGVSGVSSDLMWPTQNVVTMTFAFASCAFNGRIGHLNVARVRTMAGLFYKNVAFNQPIGAWDVRRVRSMGSMFWGATAFDQPLATWDVGRVTRMYQMFKRAASFDRPIGSWDVRNVETMRQMFKDAAAFDQPLDAWDVSRVTDMEEMFEGAVAFNRQLDAWDVGRATNVRRTFERALSLERAPAWAAGRAE
jgi:hypothetical protein